MPRKAKRTISGEPAQPTPQIPGQYYGAGVETQKLAEAAPAPDRRSAQPVSPNSSPMAVAAGSTDPFSEALQQAEMLRGRAGLFRAPSARPDEPLTAGLPVGPGPGPEALMGSQGSRQLNFLHMLSRLTGDRQFDDLARRLSG
jgi:hypothetical protein